MYPNYNYVANFSQNLSELIQTGVDVNSLDENTGDAVIHTILKDKRKHKLEVLLALLVNSDVDVNLANKRGNTALHIAIEVRHRIYN